MPKFSPDALAESLSRHFPEPAQHWCIALSGGLDSVVLLQAMVALRERHPHWTLRAIHVDHQLQSQSANWAAHCKAVAEALGVPCKVERVQLTDVSEQGVEAAARRARYAVFAETLQANEVLLTAHHADDQLETLLIALMRGSGMAGLAAMPLCMSFAAGAHLRPLLAFTRAELAEWATQQDIAFVEDPSNRDTRFDRNFLRHEVIPLLKSRWPSVAATVSRSAQHIAEADALLDRLAEQHLQAAAHGACLQIEPLRALDAPMRRLVLRHWIQAQGWLPPSTRALAALAHDMLQAAADRVPCARWSGVEVHRYRDSLYAVTARTEWNAERDLLWPWHSSLALPADMGCLRMHSESPRHDRNRAILSPNRLPETLAIRFRSGGERIRLAGESHRRELKKLLHDAQVLPWWRERVPLIYAGENLAAVADLWVSEEFCAKENEPALRIVWEGRPEIMVT